MATYEEAHEALQDEALRKRIKIGIAVSVDKINKSQDNVAPFKQLPDAATAHANRLAWAKNLPYANLEAVADQFIPLLVAANRAATLAQIVGAGAGAAAGTGALQTNVDEAVDVFAGNI